MQTIWTFQTLIITKAKLKTKRQYTYISQFLTRLKKEETKNSI